MKEGVASVVFHHNDLDGYGAAAVVASWIKENYNHIVDDTRFLVCNYTNKCVTVERLKDECGGVYPETVFVVDYSFKTQEEMEELYDMMEHGSQVFWFDHHQSSVNLLEQIKDTKFKEYARDHTLVYDVNIDHCGTYITWKNLFPDKKVPEAIDLINDWDLWIHKDDNSRYLNNAFYSALDPEEDENSLRNLWSKRWEDLFGTCEVDYPDRARLYLYISQGKAIAQYKAQTYKNWFRTYGYVTEFEGHECVCMNWKVNSEVFSDWYDQYPLHLIWCFDGSTYTYSIYTDYEKTGIDCSKIAEKYGGGGHKGAAGFTSKELLVPAGEKVFK